MSGISGVSGAFQIASSMINRATAAVGRDAAVVASPNTGGINSPDMLSALLDSRQQALYVQAAARMIETSNQMMGSLIDVKA